MPEKNRNRQPDKNPPADVAKPQKDEDVTDFASAGEAEARVAPKLAGKNGKGGRKTEDPRDDIFIPEVVNQDAAREAAESEYVSPDQPLSEPPAKAAKENTPASRKSSMDKKQRST